MNDDIINEIIKLAPPFSGVDRQLLGSWVSLAELFVCKDRFGSDYNKAVALFTLHIMTLDGAMKQEGESVSDYSVRLASFSLSGEFSQTFATSQNSSSGSSLRQTPFGKLYLMLLRKKGGGFGLISGAAGCCR